MFKSERRVLTDGQTEGIASAGRGKRWTEQASAQVVALPGAGLTPGILSLIRKDKQTVCGNFESRSRRSSNLVVDKGSIDVVFELRATSNLCAAIRISSSPSLAPRIAFALQMFTERAGGGWESIC